MTDPSSCQLSVLLKLHSIKFGSKDIKDKIHTFIKLYKTLNSSDLEKIGYIDMRYANGFSIGWKGVKQVYYGQE